MTFFQAFATCQENGDEDGLIQRRTHHFRQVLWTTASDKVVKSKSISAFKGELNFLDNNHADSLNMSVNLC